MSRLTDALLVNGGAHSAGKNTPMVDLQFGGMQGFSPVLDQWVSNQAYVRRNLICLLVEAPKGFSMLADPEVWVATLRSLVELHPLSIEGLNATLEVEFGSNPVGGGGQIHEDFTDVKETPSVPVFRWSEKYGMPVASFFRGWITNLMMDPNSKVANVATMGSGELTDLLSDQVAATMIFIEPDPTFTKVQKAWLCTNMMPKSSGEITGRRDLTQAAEPITYDITFTAIAQYGVGVDAFAQTLLTQISLTGANPQNRPAFVQEISADILSNASGYAEGIAAQAAASVV